MESIGCKQWRDHWRRLHSALPIFGTGPSMVPIVLGSKIITACESSLNVFPFLKSFTKFSSKQGCGHGAL